MGKHIRNGIVYGGGPNKAKEIATEGGTSVEEEIAGIKNAIVGQTSGLKILYGRSSFPASDAIALQSVTVNFSEAFSQAPTVLLTWNDSDNGNVFNYMDELNVGMDSISKNSFTAQTKRKMAGYSWNFNWIAIGKA